MQVHSKFDRACVVLCGLWRIRSKKTEGAAGRVIAVPSQRSKWFSLLRPWLERRNARRERLDIWRLRLPRCMLPPLRLVHARNGSYKPPAPLKSRHRSAQRRRSIMLWSEMAVGRCRRRVDHARTDHFAQSPRCPRVQVSATSSGTTSSTVLSRRTVDRRSRGFDHVFVCPACRRLVSAQPTAATPFSPVNPPKMQPQLVS